MDNFTNYVQVAAYGIIILLGVPHLTNVDGRIHRLYMFGVAGIIATCLGKLIYLLIFLGVPIPIETDLGIESKLDILFSLSSLALVLELRQGFANYWHGQERRRQQRIPLLLRMKGNK